MKEAEEQALRLEQEQEGARRLEEALEEEGRARRSVEERSMAKQAELSSRNAVLDEQLRLLRRHLKEGADELTQQGARHAEELEGLERKISTQTGVIGRLEVGLAEEEDAKSRLAAELQELNSTVVKDLQRLEKENGNLRNDVREARRATLKAEAQVKAAELEAEANKKYQVKDTIEVSLAGAVGKAAAAKKAFARSSTVAARDE